LVVAFFFRGTPPSPPTHTPPPPHVNMYFIWCCDLILVRFLQCSHDFSGSHGDTSMSSFSTLFFFLMAIIQKIAVC
jgi:hypothetical protein